jgi:hypothetical protein
MMDSGMDRRAFLQGAAAAIVAAALGPRPSQTEVAPIVRVVGVEASNVVPRAIWGWSGIDDPAYFFEDEDGYREVTEQEQRELIARFDARAKAWLGEGTFWERLEESRL